MVDLSDFSFPGASHKREELRSKGPQLEGMGIHICEISTAGFGPDDYHHPNCGGRL